VDLLIRAVTFEIDVETTRRPWSFQAMLQS
jgi:hypothetical protein